MKTQPDRLEDLRHRRREADLEATIKALFRRFPALCGFAVASAPDCARGGRVGEHAGELFVTGVSVYPMAGSGVPYALSEEIAATLVELIDEDPLACELLRERTFARRSH